VAVDGGVADAEVVGEAAEEETREVALAEVAGEAGGGAVVVFKEGGVAVDVTTEAFAEDQFGVGDVQRWVEGCAYSVLEDVFGPKGLGAVRGIDYFVGLFRVGCREGDVLGGVPVLGEDDVVKFLGEGVDEGDDGVAVGYGQGAARHEIVLDVDDQESVGGMELHRDLMVVQWASSAVVLCTMAPYLKVEIRAPGSVVRA
jgi:hypothetical protein